MCPKRGTCRSLTLSASLLAAALAGCGGPPVGEVSGTITLNGRAPSIAGLTVNFLGADGKAVTAEVAQDGTFRAPRVPVGEAKVGLFYQPPEAAQGIDRIGKGRPQTPEEFEKGPGKGVKLDPSLLKPEMKDYRGSLYKNPIPERYRDPRTSQKTITVEEGKANVLTWDVRP